MADNFYRQYLAQLGAPQRIQDNVDRALRRTEQPQPQPGTRLNGIPQNSRLPTVPQPRQVHPVQSQPQPQPYYRSSTFSAATLPTDDGLSGIFGHFLTQLRNQQQHINDSLVKSDKYLEALVSSVSSIRATVDGLTNKLEAHDQILEKLERSGLGDSRTKAKEIDVMKVLVGEMKSFKKVLGKSCDGDDGRTVLGRLDAVTFAVGELLERARDPEANLLEPSASIIPVPPIDLTTSPSPGPPPVRCTPPFQSHTYMNVGTSPVPSPPPLKEKTFASIQVGPSPRASPDLFFQSAMESTPYSGRFSSAHTLVDNTTSSPDISFTALTQERLELAAPTPMNVDFVGPTNPTPDSQMCTSESTVGTDHSEDAQTESQLSDNTPASMEKRPRVENITMHPVMHSDFASPESAQTPQDITGLDGPAHTNDRVDHDAGLLNVTPGPKADIPTFEQPYIPAPVATSRASPAFPAEDMDSERLSVGAGRRDHNEEKIRASSKRGEEEGKDKKEEIKRIAKRGSQLNRNHDGDVPVPTSGLIDLSQHLQGRPRSSSSCFASPSTSLTSLSVGGIAGSTLNVDYSENVSMSPNTRLYSPTKTQVLVGANRSPGSVFRVAAAPPTTPVSTSNSTKIPPTTPIRETASVVSSPKLYSPTRTKVLAGAGRSPGSVFYTPAAPPTTPPTIAVSTSNSTKIPPTTPIREAASVVSSPKLYSPTMTKVLAGANRSPGSVFRAAAAPPTTSPVSTSNSTRIPPTTPIREAASVVSSQLVPQPTTPNAGLVTASIIASPAIETSLLRDLSPLSDVESDVETGKDMTKDTDGQVADDLLKKRDISLSEDADIVRAKKRKISEESSIVKRRVSLEEESPVVKGKPSLLSLKAGKKGESAAITRVKKRKVTSNFVIGGEVEGKGDDDDGLDQERPLKRARQRVSERQMKMESLEKGRRLTREFSGSNLGPGSSAVKLSVASGSGIVATRIKKQSPSDSTSTKTRKSSPPSKGRLSARGLGKVEVEWPEMTQADENEDLVECNRCQAWYHYGCVGITAGDARLHNGKKYICPPCEAGTFITKLSTDTYCWRPGCVVPAGFIVEKIIGRFKKLVDGEGTQFKYLLRWKGYKLSEATWEPEESMYDPPFMIDKFRIDALEEGIDIDKDKTGLVLLRIAKHPCVPKPM